MWLNALVEFFSSHLLFAGNSKQNSGHPGWEYQEKNVHQFMLFVVGLTVTL